MVEIREQWPTTQFLRTKNGSKFNQVHIAYRYRIYKMSQHVCLESLTFSCELSGFPKLLADIKTQGQLVTCSSQKVHEDNWWSSWRSRNFQGCLKQVKTKTNHSDEIPVVERLFRVNLESIQPMVRLGGLGPGGLDSWEPLMKGFVT